MRYGPVALALTLSFGLASVAAAAPTGTKSLLPTTRKPHHHHVRGVVVAVRQDATKGGEIEVKIHHHHHKKTAKTAAAAATTRKKRQGVVTVKVHPSTKFEKVIHSQGQVIHSNAGFAEVKTGAHVHVTLTATHHHAKHVAIVVHHHNKKLTKPTPTKKPVKKLK